RRTWSSHKGIWTVSKTLAKCLTSNRGDGSARLLNARLIRSVRVAPEDIDMPLESATYISDLDPSNPVGSSDLVSSLDDHMRLVKATLQTTFPGITGAVTATHVELNHLDGVTGTTGTGKLVLDDAPTIADLTVTDSITLPAASIADAALSGNVPLKDAPNTFTALQTLAYDDPSIQLVETDAGENEGVWWIRVQAGRFIIQGRQDSGSASGAANIIDIFRKAGALSAAEIELNADALDFNGDADISGALTVGGTITGNGSGLTNLNASNLSSGTVPGARLGGDQTMAGNKTFSNNVTVGGTISGNGSGLTNLNASNLSSGTVPEARLS